LLSLGREKDNQKYSKLISEKATRTKFIDHLINYLKEHNFDGIDIDWQYEKCVANNCTANNLDRTNFAQFINVSNKSALKYCISTLYRLKLR
jgi:chitinase